jgi:hypothetical protein
MVGLVDNLGSLVPPAVPANKSKMWYSSSDASVPSVYRSLHLDAFKESIPAWTGLLLSLYRTVRPHCFILADMIWRCRSLRSKVMR